MKYRIRDMLYAAIAALPAFLFLHWLTHPDMMSASQYLVAFLCAVVYGFIGMGVYFSLKAWK